jgi:hypothetical protein
MITINKSSIHIKNLNDFSSELNHLDQFDNINQKVVLSVTILGSFHCIIIFKAIAFNLWYN